MADEDEPVHQKIAVFHACRATKCATDWEKYMSCAKRIEVSPLPFPPLPLPLSLPPHAAPLPNTQARTHARAHPHPAHLPGCSTNAHAPLFCTPTRGAGWPASG